jgi:hypothetical protein
MIWRWFLGKEWKTLDDAFYYKPPISPFRGSYWCWLVQGFENNPKIWLFVSFMGVKNKVNGVETYDGYCDDGTLKTLMGSWFIKNNKLTDFFLEHGLTTINKNSLVTRSKTGFEIKLHGHHPNHTLSLEKNGKKIFECINKSLEFDVEPIIYRQDYNTKSYLTKDKKSYWLLSETVRLPVIAKSTNLFTNADCEFFGEKFNGITYTEKYHGFGPPVPWKYTIFDFKDGSRFRFFFAYGNVIKSIHDLSFTFDCASTNKKYFFEKLNNIKHYYLDQNMKNPHENFCSISRFVFVKANNENKVRIELLAEIMNNHVYKYNKWFLYENYNQHILKLKKMKLFEGKREIRIDTNNAIGYGEYVNITRK